MLKQNAISYKAEKSQGNFDWYHNHNADAYFTRRSCHYDDVIMSAIASQITSLTIVYSIVYSDADQRKHQSSASLAFVRGIHRGPVNSPHKWPVTRKMFPFDDVIMSCFVSCSVRDVVAGTSVTVIRTYSPVAEYFGHFDGRDVNTLQAANSTARDAMARGRYGQRSRGTVQLRC